MNEKLSLAELQKGLRWAERQYGKNHLITKEIKRQLFQAQRREANGDSAVLLRQS